MQNLFDNFAIPAITATIGFFWFLAYKHFQTFRKIGSFFAFMAVIGLVGSGGYMLAWSRYDLEIGSWSGFWSDRMTIDEYNKLEKPLKDTINTIGRDVIPLAVASAALLLILAFFSIVGGMIHLEKAEETKKPKYKKENKDTESESREHGN